MLKIFWKNEDMTLSEQKELLRELEEYLAAVDEKALRTRRTELRKELKLKLGALARQAGFSVEFYEPMALHMNPEYRQQVEEISDIEREICSADAETNEYKFVLAHYSALEEKIYGDTISLRVLPPE